MSFFDYFMEQYEEEDSKKIKVTREMTEWDGDKEDLNICYDEEMANHEIYLSEYDYTIKYDEDGHPLTEMANIGKFGNYKVIVNGDEGPNPHFHFKYSMKHGCIMITEPEYFNHGSKQATLNSKEKRELDSFLRKISKDGILTNWQRARNAWNDNNPRWEISNDIEMPDYNEL